MGKVTENPAKGKPSLVLRCAALVCANSYLARCLRSLFIYCTTVAKARGMHLRIHFKHCREIGEAIKGRTIEKARSYLENVLKFKEAIPITKYTGGRGRHAAGKRYKAPGDLCFFPQKATKSFLDLLRNVEANAEVTHQSLLLALESSPSCDNFIRSFVCLFTRRRVSKWTKLFSHTLTAIRRRKCDAEPTEHMVVSMRTTPLPHTSR